MVQAWQTMYMWTDSVIFNVRLSSWQLTLARNVRWIFGSKLNPNPSNFRGCSFPTFRNDANIDFNMRIQLSE